MNTPLLYSIVPIAPSKTTMDAGSRRRWSLALSAPDGIVLGLWMVHDDRRRALFRHELERARELHAQLALGRKNLEELPVVLQVGAGAVAPRVALALSGGNAKLVARMAVRPFGDGFGGLHRDAVHIERFGVFAVRLKLLEQLARGVPDGHHLKYGDVDIARLDGAEIVRDAQTLTTFLPW